MESSHTLQDYIKLCAECKDIAVEVHPSYKQQYADVATMIRLPANLMTALIDDQHLYMECKKKTLERMLSAIGLSVKSVASKPVCQPQANMCLLWTLLVHCLRKG